MGAVRLARVGGWPGFGYGGEVAGRGKGELNITFTSRRISSGCTMLS